MKSAVFCRVQCELKILFSSTKVGLRGVLPLGAATGTRNFAAVHSTLLWSLPSAHWQRAVAEAAILNGCSWSSASCWRLCWVTFRMISALLYVVVCAGCVHNFFLFSFFLFYSYMYKQVIRAKITHALVREQKRLSCWTSLPMCKGDTDSCIL